MNRGFFGVWAGLTVLVAGVVPGGWALPGPPSAPRSPSTSGKVSAPAGIPNFAVVAPGIYRGGAPTAEGLKALHAMGVRMVVDLRIEKKGQEAEAGQCRSLGLERIRIRMGREAPTQKQLEEFLATVDRAPAKPVFIHCQHGADRTGAMVGIYRVVRQGWDFARVREEMRKYGFKPWLDELEDSVRSRATRSRTPARKGG